VGRFAIYFAGCVCASLLTVGCWIQRKPAVFLTTVSPNKTYIVNLRGGKATLPSQVTADVLKTGKVFLSDIRLHTRGDAVDLPFGAGYPDVRWVSDNVLEFYRTQNFDNGADAVEIQNQTTRAIQYLHVESLNKFLMFGIEPGTSTTLEVPAPGGNSQWIAVEGSFFDGQKVEFKSRSFDRRFSQRDRSFYQIIITDVGPIINQ